MSAQTLQGWSFLTLSMGNQKHDPPRKPRLDRMEAAAPRVVDRLRSAGKVKTQVEATCPRRNARGGAGAPRIGLVAFVGLVPALTTYIWRHCMRRGGFTYGSVQRRELGSIADGNYP